MKKFLLAILALLLSGNLSVSAQEQSDAPQVSEHKILIAYYSISGNTEKVAKAIQKRIGGELFRIETLKEYPEDYEDLVAEAKQEINKKYRPQLKKGVSDISQYDTIFIGSPNWWGTITPAVSSFLTSYNLSGKTIVPFITHGSGGVQNTIKDLTAQCEGCNVVQNGWAGFRDRTLGVAGWLEELGYLK